MSHFILIYTVCQITSANIKKKYFILTFSNVRKKYFFLNFCRRSFVVCSFSFIHLFFLFLYEFLFSQDDFVFEFSFPQDEDETQNRHVYKEVNPDTPSSGQGIDLEYETLTDPDYLNSSTDNYYQSLNAPIATETQQNAKEDVQLPVSTEQMRILTEKAHAVEITLY